MTCQVHLKNGDLVLKTETCPVGGLLGNQMAQTPKTLHASKALKGDAIESSTRA